MKFTESFQSLSVCHLNYKLKDFSFHIAFHHYTVVAVRMQVEVQQQYSKINTDTL
jgi:hypothetical protein